MKTFVSVVVGVTLGFVSGSALVAEDKKSADKETNLLVNGGFEEGIDDIGEFKPLDKGSTDIKGWTVIRAQIDYIGSYWQPAGGKRSLDLHGSPGIGGVSQTFKTTKGQKYRVTFHLAANPDGTVAKKKVGVKAGGKEKEFEFDATGKTREQMGWEKKTWEFTATDDETTLEIFSTMTEDEACGPALDEVSVVAVKE
jgi:choice-of-anchor C domain-containing protein